MIKEKNWLIRTSNFQILGPVSKEKIVEFLNKGSLKGEDEVTCGNGYWFLIKEQDLVDKYILGDVPQTFNPISEAPNVLTANNSSEQTGTHNKITKPVKAKDTDADEINLPADGDLEYPDMTLPESGDLEYPDMSSPSGEMSLDSLNTAPAPSPVPAASRPAPVELSAEDELEGLLPDDEDLEYPDMEMGSSSEATDDNIVLDELEDSTNPSLSEVEEETDPSITPLEVISEPVAAAVPAPLPTQNPVRAVKKNTIAPKGKAPRSAPAKRAPKIKKKQRNDKLLLILTAIFCITFLFASVIFYYKKVLNKPLPFTSSSFIELLIPQAQAQDSLVKKKTFLILKK
jgi:hypothetical protein